MKPVILLVTILLLLPHVVSAGTQPLSGAELFNAVELGSNGKSCATCHPDGKGLEQIEDYDDAILREFVNFCIRDAMKGEMLAEDAPELQRVVDYMRQLQRDN